MDSMEVLADTFSDFGSFHQKHGIRELITRLNSGEVPEYFVKPPSERSVAEEFELGDLETEQIPCINLQGLSPGDLLASTEAACKNWGIFHVINHGVPISLLQDMQRCTREFFALPHEDKLQITTAAGFAGPVHFGGGGNRDWREVLRIHYAPPSQVAKDYWPSKPRGFRRLLEEYAYHLQKLSENLLTVISCSLGLREGFLFEACGEAKASVTVNHAPPSLDPSLTMGHRAHSDPNMLTIILQDDVGGLQVQKYGRWLDIPPLESAFIVNIGDQLQILSNRKYRSCLHRVVNNSHSARTSTAFFLSPSRNSIIGPASDLIDENESPLYSQKLYGDYLDDFYRSANCTIEQHKSSGPELQQDCDPKYISSTATDLP